MDGLKYSFLYSLHILEELHIPNSSTLLYKLLIYQIYYSSATSVIEEALRRFSILCLVELVEMTSGIILTHSGTGWSILYKQFYCQEVAICKGTFLWSSSVNIQKCKNYFKWMIFYHISPNYGAGRHCVQKRI